MLNVCSSLTDVGVAIENPPRWLPYRDRPLSFESEEEYDKTKVVASYCEVAHDGFATPCRAWPRTVLRALFSILSTNKTTTMAIAALPPLRKPETGSAVWTANGGGSLEGPVAARDGVASTWR
ncbi:hypothetical protein MRX96_018840 [Rhipicephalus microplus]